MSNAAEDKKPFLDGYRHNFATLQDAQRAGRLALLECQDRATGKKVAVIIALSDTDGDEFSMVPLAKMFDGNPYEELDPPDPAGGFNEQFDRDLFKKLDFSRCEEHFKKCVEFARSVDKWTGQNGLRTCLERLVRIGGNGANKKPSLYKDFAPYSFEFSAGGMQGGLIFHGKHDEGGNGSAPTYSVSLEPVDGWSLHT